jgi:hypothetical protein
MHGGGPGSGGQLGNRNALKHGRYTAEAAALRLQVRDLLDAVRELIEEVR